MIVKAQPEPRMFDEFLRIRTTEDGSTLRDLFLEPETLEDGKIKYAFKQFRAHDLPTTSEGEFAYENGYEPTWVTRFHGLKMEALYSVLADIRSQQGGLKASGD